MGFWVGIKAPEVKQAQLQRTCKRHDTQEAPVVLIWRLIREFMSLQPWHCDITPLTAAGLCQLSV